MLGREEGKCNITQKTTAVAWKTVYATQKTTTKMNKKLFSGLKPPNPK